MSLCPSFIRYLPIPLIFISFLSLFLYSLTCGFLQREISQASDAAARAYKDNTPPQERTAIGVFKAMSSAEEKARKSYRSKSFEKYIAVANPKNGEAFFDEVLHLLASLFLFFSIVDSFLNNVYNILFYSCRLTSTIPATRSPICSLRSLPRWQMLMLNLGLRQSGFSGGIPP